MRHTYTKLHVGPEGDVVVCECVYRQKTQGGYPTMNMRNFRRYESNYNAMNNLYWFEDKIAVASLEGTK